MAIKSAYKTRTPLLLDTKVVEADPSKAELLPEEPIQPSESVKIEFTNNKADVAAIEPADEATLTLQKQIADLKKSEELQKQYALHVAAARTQPPTREQKLEYWRSQGMDDQEFHFLSNNPELVDKPEITQQAAAAALRAGLERGTHEFNNAVKLNFDTMLGRVEAQAQPAAPVQPAPAFFAPPSPAVSERPGPASYVSAPVSRHAAGSPRGSQSSMKLSAAEVEMARIAGISDVEYAKQKQKLAQAKANGDYGERR